MAAVYARFKDGAGSWKYEKVGKGRPPKDASFHVRFTDATGKRRWSKPFKSVEDANANSEGVKIASEAAARGELEPKLVDHLVKDIESRDWHLSTGFLGTPFLLF